MVGRTRLSGTLYALCLSSLRSESISVESKVLMIMSMEEWWNDIERETSKHSKNALLLRNCPKWILFDCITIVSAGSNNYMLLICAYILNIDSLLCCALCP